MATSVSIAIATYNGVRFLPDLLASFLTQTRLPDQLVVSDDASSDDSIALVRNFAQTAPFPVKIVAHPVNIGVLENFYAAFDACEGDVIFYCDQDDVWMPNKIAVLMTAFENAQTHYASHSSLVVDENLEGSAIIQRNPGYGCLSFPVDTMNVYAHGHQMAFDRKVLAVMQQIRGPIGPLAPDLFSNFDDLIPFAASLIGNLHLFDAPLVKFRRHGGSVTTLGKEDPAAQTGAITRLAQRARASGREVAIRKRALAAIRKLDVLPDAPTSHYMAALDRRARISEATLAANDRGGLGRLMSAIGGGLAIVWPRTGFSNDRRVRELALVAASLVAGKVAAHP